MKGLYSIFKDTDNKRFSTSDSIVIISSIKTSSSPLCDLSKKAQMVEISMLLFDLDDCKVFGEYSTKLVKYKDSYFWDNCYNSSTNDLNKEDLVDGYSFNELMVYIYNKIWYSAYQKPKKVKVLLINKGIYSPYFEDLFSDSQKCLGRTLKDSDYYDYQEFDFSNSFAKFLKSRSVKFDDYFDLYALFNLNISHNTLNQSFVLAGFFYLSKVYESCLKADLNDHLIIERLYDIKSKISKEIIETSNAVSRYILPEAVV